MALQGADSLPLTGGWTCFQFEGGALMSRALSRARGRRSMRWSGREERRVYVDEGVSGRTASRSNHSAADCSGDRPLGYTVGGRTSLESNFECSILAPGESAIPSSVGGTESINIWPPYKARPWRAPRRPRNVVIGRRTSGVFEVSSLNSFPHRPYPQKSTTQATAPR
jgi:hypothetical protein